MEPNSTAIIDFELTELKLIIGEGFNRFIAGTDLRTDQATYIAMKDAKEVKYRLERATDVLCEMLCFHLATIRVNGGTIGDKEIKHLVKRIIDETNELAAGMEVEKRECMDRMGELNEDPSGRG